MSRDIWVYTEQVRGNISGVSVELLGKAIKLRDSMKEPGKVTAVIIGSQLDQLTKKVSEYGSERIYVADDERLVFYQPEYYASIILDLIKGNDPHIMLFGATSIGSQLGPMIAAKAKTGIAAHCVELKINDNDDLISVVPAFGGKVLGDILCPNHRPQMASVKPGIFSKPEMVKANDCQVIPVDLRFLDSFKPRLTPIKLSYEETKGIQLEEADVVVCGGFGIGDKEHWEMLEEIAGKLGGATGCTRPALDEGWTKGEHTMVGTSGKSIRPKVYIGFGISGATHHVCGMKNSNIIINVNRDENAEIFKVSDYGIVGDVKEVAPLLLEALNEG